MNSIHNNLTNMGWFSHLTQLCNMCLLDRVYCTFCRSQVRQRLLKIFVCFFSFLIYLCCLIFTVLSYNCYLFSSLFSFLIFNFELLDELIYFFLGFLQFNLFFLQVDLKFFNTLCCFLKFIKT